MHDRPRPMPHTSRQPGENRHVRRIGHDLTMKLDKPSDWLGLGTR